MADSPQTPMQQWVGRVWSEVIGTAPPRLSDNFTALGGHSLHAVRITFLLRDRLGIPVRLAMLFDTADLGELCRLLEDELTRRGLAPDLSGPAPSGDDVPDRTTAEPAGPAGPGPSR